MPKTSLSVYERIKDLKKSGKSKEEIYLDLLNNKFTVDQIESAFRPKVSVIENKPQLVVSRPQTEEEKAAAYHKTVNMIFVIGAILVGAGVFAFITANWSAMPKYLKLFTIIFFMCASYSAGYYLQFKTAYTKTGESLIFLGSIIYGGGIFLIGQIFNIQTDWINGFLLWMLGVMVLAFALNSKRLHSFSLLIGILSMISIVIMVIFSYAFFNYSREFMEIENKANIQTSLVLVVTTLACVYSGIYFNKNRST